MSISIVLPVVSVRSVEECLVFFLSAVIIKYSQRINERRRRLRTFFNQEAVLIFPSGGGSRFITEIEWVQGEHIRHCCSNTVHYKL